MIWYLNLFHPMLSHVHVTTSSEYGPAWNAVVRYVSSLLNLSPILNEFSAVLHRIRRFQAFRHRHSPACPEWAKHWSKTEISSKGPVQIPAMTLRPRLEKGWDILRAGNLEKGLHHILRPSWNPSSSPRPGGFFAHAFLFEENYNAIFLVSIWKIMKASPYERSITVLSQWLVVQN